ncbi:hypothetical protein PENTCL1PPCAC_14086, partial [Pristionchus entomophagus]
YDQYKGIQRGCITNNETLFPGLYQVGFIKTINLELILCNSTMCNADWNSTDNLIPGIDIVPSTTLNTTTASKQSLFESEYMKLFSAVKLALDNFITRFATIQG